MFRVVFVDADDPVRGLRVRTAPLPVGDIVRASIPRTTPIRSCVDIARESNFIEAVVALDLVPGERNHLRKPDSGSLWRWPVCIRCLSK